MQSKTSSFPFDDCLLEAYIVAIRWLSYGVSVAEELEG